MTQTTLNFDAPIARTTDPATSHIAAAETRSKLGQLQQAFVNECWSTDPMTAAEIAARCVACYGGCAESYRKRAAECVRLGLLRIDGVRVCSITGKKASVYVRSTP